MQTKKQFEELGEKKVSNPENVIGGRADAYMLGITSRTTGDGSMYWNYDEASFDSGGVEISPAHHPWTEGAYA